MFKVPGAELRIFRRRVLEPGGVRGRSNLVLCEARR